MWSGPRNVSTALMRAWGSRRDCSVVDEPFYAYYLQRTGLDHPGRADVLTAQPTDWRVVSDQLTHGPPPAGMSVLYSKQMTHHLLPEVDRSALDGLRHGFLVRDPAEMVLSYARVRGEPTLDDLGLPQQVELYERFGGPVLDARDLLERPAKMLQGLCAGLGVAFDPAMLSWAAGPRDTDGVWGPHWYAGVWRSTGFTAYRPPKDTLPDRLRPLLERCQPYYDAMVAHRMTA